MCLTYCYHASRLTATRCICWLNRRISILITSEPYLLLIAVATVYVLTINHSPAKELKTKGGVKLMKSHVNNILQPLYLAAPLRIALDFYAPDLAALVCL